MLIGLMETIAGESRQTNFVFQKIHTDGWNSLKPEEKRLIISSCRSAVNHIKSRVNDHLFDRYKI